MESSGHTATCGKMVPQMTVTKQPRNSGKEDEIS